MESPLFCGYTNKQTEQIWSINEQTLCQYLTDSNSKYTIYISYVNTLRNRGRGIEGV